jgi:hypothetical protein
MKIDLSGILLADSPNNFKQELDENLSTNLEQNKEGEN